MFVVPGTFVRRSDMASLFDRRGHLTPETQHFEEEESHSVRAFAQLRRLGLGFVTVSHANLVGLIRIPRLSTHKWNATGSWASGSRIGARSPVARPLDDDAVSSHHRHEPGY